MAYLGLHRPLDLFTPKFLRLLPNFIMIKHQLIPIVRLQLFGKLITNASLLQDEKILLFF
jgi:hypothetical protein